MKRNTLYTAMLLGAAGLFAACANTGSDNAGTSEGADGTADQEMMVDGHHAANALDYFGTYLGHLPCADCEGESINVEIAIDADSTFRYTRFGADESAEPETVTGTWSIDRNTITFNEAGLSLHVAENRLIPIDEDGSRFTGEREEQFSLHKLF